ncbi:MAG TPA: 3-deoxy-D-manno-octulosonic acid transferase [Beijerinckiaceae bacterium]|nr:3-deoxy-D-manno-octulosonic acid transferase [Beijerinckiaceae bacterium]
MSAHSPFLLKLYRGGLVALEPAAAGLLLWRQRKGKEDRERLQERRGWATHGRPAGQLAWLHGASIGETLSLMPVVEQLMLRGIEVLVTSGTRTSAEVLARRLPPGAMHQFVPLDVPRYVQRFLDHWQPDLVLFAESEVWPNIIMELERRRIPLVLVNGRLSERSYQRWSRLPHVARALFQRFALCIAQSADDAERLARLGASRVSVAGNLKFDSPPPPADPRVLARLSGLVAGRPLWLAASTHPGEEEMIVDVHRGLMDRFPDLLTIIAPRHPHRGTEAAEIASGAQLTVARRAGQENPSRDIDVYLADTVGELGLFYRLAPLVFMGGSLVPHGGQNPIEPVKLGSAILHGPHVHNFTDVYRALDRAGGALPIPNAPTLVRALTELLADPRLAREMSRAAGETVDNLGGGVARTMQSIEPFILQMKLEAR